MPSVVKNKIVSYTAKQMYDLVNDIESYSAFVPFCVSSEITQNNGDDELHASLAFSFAGFHKSFITFNRLRPHKMIEIRLVDGPFKHLEGFWSFEEINDTQCRVSLDMEFEFSSPILAITFGPMFNQITTQLVDTFCERAKKVYGD